MAAPLSSFGASNGNGTSTPPFMRPTAPVSPFCHEAFRFEDVVAEAALRQGSGLSSQGKAVGGGGLAVSPDAMASKDFGARRVSSGRVGGDVLADDGLTTGPSSAGAASAPSATAERINDGHHQPHQHQQSAVGAEAASSINSDGEDGNNDDAAFVMEALLLQSLEPEYVFAKALRYANHLVTEEAAAREAARVHKMQLLRQQRRMAVRERHAAIMKGGGVGVGFGSFGGGGGGGPSPSAVGLSPHCHNGSPHSSGIRGGPAAAVVSSNGVVYAHRHIIGSEGPSASLSPPTGPPSWEPTPMLIPSSGWSVPPLHCEVAMPPPTPCDSENGIGGGGGGACCGSSPSAPPLRNGSLAQYAAGTASGGLGGSGFYVNDSMGDGAMVHNHSYCSGYFRNANVATVSGGGTAAIMIPSSTTMVPATAPSAPSSFSRRSGGGFGGSHHPLPLSAATVAASSSNNNNACATINISTSSGRAAFWNNNSIASVSSEAGHGHGGGVGSPDEWAGCSSGAVGSIGIGIGIAAPPPPACSNAHPPYSHGMGFGSRSRSGGGGGMVHNGSMSGPPQFLTTFASRGGSFAGGDFVGAAGSGGMLDSNNSSVRGGGGPWDGSGTMVSIGGQDDLSDIPLYAEPPQQHPLTAFCGAFCKAGVRSLERYCATIQRMSAVVDESAPVVACLMVRLHRRVLRMVLEVLWGRRQFHVRRAREAQALADANNATNSASKGEGEGSQQLPLHCAAASPTAEEPSPSSPSAFAYSPNGLVVSPTDSFAREPAVVSPRAAAGIGVVTFVEGGGAASSSAYSPSSGSPLASGGVGGVGRQRSRLLSITSTGAAAMHSTDSLPSGSPSRVISRHPTPQPEGPGRSRGALAAASCDYYRFNTSFGGQPHAFAHPHQCLASDGQQIEEQHGGRLHTYAATQHPFDSAADEALFKRLEKAFSVPMPATACNRLLAVCIMLGTKLCSDKRHDLKYYATLTGLGAEHSSLASYEQEALRVLGYGALFVHADHLDALILGLGREEESNNTCGDIDDGRVRRERSTLSNYRLCADRQDAPTPLPPLPPPPPLPRGPTVQQPINGAALQSQQVPPRSPDTPGTRRGSAYRDAPPSPDFGEAPSPVNVTFHNLISPERGGDAVAQGNGYGETPVRCSGALFTSQGATPVGGGFGVKGALDASNSGRANRSSAFFSVNSSATAPNSFSPNGGVALQPQEAYAPAGGASGLGSQQQPIASVAVASPTATPVAVASFSHCRARAAQEADMADEARERQRMLRHTAAPPSLFAQSTSAPNTVIGGGEEGISVSSSDASSGALRGIVGSTKGDLSPPSSSSAGALGSVGAAVTPSPSPQPTATTSPAVRATSATTASVTPGRISHEALTAMLASIEATQHARSLRSDVAEQNKNRYGTGAKLSGAASGVAVSSSAPPLVGIAASNSSGGAVSSPSHSGPSAPMSRHGTAVTVGSALGAVSSESTNEGDAVGTEENPSTLTMIATAAGDGGAPSTTALPPTARHRTFTTNETATGAKWTTMVASNARSGGASLGSGGATGDAAPLSSVSQPFRPPHAGAEATTAAAAAVGRRNVFSASYASNMIQRGVHSGGAPHPPPSQYSANPHAFGYSTFPSTPGGVGSPTGGNSLLGSPPPCGSPPFPMSIVGGAALNSPPQPALSQGQSVGNTHADAAYCYSYGGGSLPTTPPMGLSGHGGAPQMPRVASHGHMPTDEGGGGNRGGCGYASLQHSPPLACRTPPLGVASGDFSHLRGYAMRSAYAQQQQHHHEDGGDHQRFGPPLHRRTASVASSGFGLCGGGGAAFDVVSEASTYTTLVRRARAVPNFEGITAPIGSAPRWVAEASGGAEGDWAQRDVGGGCSPVHFDAALLAGLTTPSQWAAGHAEGGSDGAAPTGAHTPVSGEGGPSDASEAEASAVAPQQPSYRSALGIRRRTGQPSPVGPPTTDVSVPVAPTPVHPPTASSAASAPPRGARQIPASLFTLSQPNAQQSLQHATTTATAGTCTPAAASSTSSFVGMYGQNMARPSNKAANTGMGGFRGTVLTAASLRANAASLESRGDATSGDVPAPTHIYAGARGPSASTMLPSSASAASAHAPPAVHVGSNAQPPGFSSQPTAPRPLPQLNFEDFV